MFGSKALSLPPPFPQDHRSQRLYAEPARPQHTGQCHFVVVHPGSKEQRCPCQGYQHNLGVPNSICDCAHAACYHAPNPIAENPMLHDGSTSNGISLSNLLERIRSLEDTAQYERHTRETMMIQQRQTWEKEIRVLKEALTPFYKSEQDMQQKLAEIEDRLDDTVNEQTRIRVRVTNIEDASTAPGGRGYSLPGTTLSADQRGGPLTNGLGPHDTSALDSVSEGRTSLSADPMSPRPSSNVVVEQESPRSSGILNLVEVPRPPPPQYALPPRLSPPLEVEEPRSSGFLALDVRGLIHRRKFQMPPAHAYSSPSSSTTKSPPVMSSHSMTPQSLPRNSPPNLHLNGQLAEFEDRAHKKRKHQTGHMALELLAHVSAASPVIS